MSQQSLPHQSNPTEARDRSVPARCLALLACAALTLPANAVDKITYDDHVFPIFEQACLNCHNPDKAKGGLDLSNYGGVMQGGSGGKVALTGDGASSTLYTSVIHQSENKMPPKGDKLPKKSADLIRAWIDNGLLESQSSTARKRTGPKIDLSVKLDSSAKPDGPPPMPEGLSLEPRVVAPRGTAVADMATSPWAPLLAITGQKQVLLYNTDTLRLAGVLPFDAGLPEVLSFHPSGTYLLAGGGIPGKSGTTITWDIKTGKELMRNGREFDSVLGASLRLDLGGVAIGGPSRLIKLWDTQSAEQIASIKKHTDWITSLAYSPDGILLATADRNGGVWIWEAETGNEFHTLRAHKNGVNAVTWRADSNLLATASEDGDVIFWEMNNGKQVKKITAHANGVLAFDYARNGHFVTSGRDKKVRIWKPDFNILKELPTFSEMIVEVAITHDGKRLFTADWNGRVEAWDATSFQKIGELSTNPPRIADRLAALDNELAKLPAEIAAAETKLKGAESAVTAARGHLDQARQKHHAAKTRIPQIKTELDKIMTERQQLDVRRGTLSETRQKWQQSLEGDRKLLAQANKEIEAARQDIVQQERAPEPADDTTRAAAKLAALKERCALLEEHPTRFQEKIATTEKALNESNAAWNDLEARRKQLEVTRQKLTAESQALTKQLPDLEKAIKPAQDQLAAKEKAVAPAKAALDTVRQREKSLRQDREFWKVAAT